MKRSVECIGCIILLVVIISLQLYQISSIHKKEDYTENISISITEGRPSLQGSPYERELLQGELVLGYANYGGTNYDHPTVCGGMVPRYPI